MFTKKQISSVDPEVAVVLEELNKEERILNLNQAHIGKRVVFNEKVLGCNAVNDTLSVVSEEGVLSDVELHTYSEPVYNLKREPTPFACVKHDEEGFCKEEH